MTTRTELAYVQARLQAWHGRRPRPETWQSLETTTGAHAFLNAARRTSLRPWVAHLTARMGPHAIERSLRADFRDHVLRVARWSPPPWRAPVAWCACLPDLAPARHAAATGHAPEWVRADPWLAMQLSNATLVPPSWLRRILARPGLPEWPGADPPGAWLTIWRSLLAEAGCGADVRRTAEAVARHVERMRSAGAPASGEALRGALADELVRLFRREARQPAALFCHIALVALDLIRLRGALLERQLFGSASPGTA